MIVKARSVLTLKTTGELLTGILALFYMKFFGLSVAAK